MFGYIRRIPTSTVKIIMVTGINEKMKPKAQADALSQSAFFVKFEIVR
jgi:hypothetical protein